MSGQREEEGGRSIWARLTNVRRNSHLSESDRWGFSPDVCSAGLEKSGARMGERSRWVGRVGVGWGLGWGWGEGGGEGVGGGWVGGWGGGCW